MHVLKIRKNAELQLSDTEVTNIYCALIVYNGIVGGKHLKENNQKLLDEMTVLMREMGF